MFGADVVSSSVGSCSTQARRVAWHKATSDQINAYQSCVRESYKQFVIPDHVLNCSDPRCKVHCDCLSTLCHDLVCCLVSCADATIPPASHRKRVAGWKDEIPPFKERSLFWNRLWYVNWMEGKWRSEASKQVACMKHSNSPV